MTVGRNNRIFCIHFQTKQVKSWLAPEKFFHERSNAISFVRVLRRYLGNNILWKKKFFFILTNLTLIFSFSFEKKNKYKASRVRDNFYKQIYLLIGKMNEYEANIKFDQISLSLVNIFIFIDRWISKEKNYDFSVRKIEIRNLFFWKRRKEEFVFSKLWITQERKLSAKQSKHGESCARRGTIVQGRSTRVFFYHRRSLLASPIIQNYSLNRSLHDFNESIIN